MADQNANKPGMLDKYYSWATKKNDKGGFTNLWINNALWFVLGALVDGKLLHIFSDAKK